MNLPALFVNPVRFFMNPYLYISLSFFFSGIVSLALKAKLTRGHPEGGSFLSYHGV